MNVRPVIAQNSPSWLALAAVGCALVGCGGPYDASVAGMATLDGSPLPRGTVSFNPVQPGPASYGGILGDGTYVVKTGREEGLPSGEYVVTVVSKEEAIEVHPDQGLPPQPGKTITPEWYRSPRSSTLRFTVEPGSNEINLALTSEPPPDWKPQRKR